jgi:hypothetical protein
VTHQHSAAVEEYVAGNVVHPSAQMDGAVMYEAYVTSNGDGRRPIDVGVDSPVEDDNAEPLMGRSCANDRKMPETQEIPSGHAA